MLLPHVKADVDAIQRKDDAYHFVERYGPAIIGTAAFGGAISVMTNSTLTKNTSANDMSVGLAGQMKVAKLNGKASVSLGSNTSEENKNFKYKLDAYGGDTDILLDQSGKENAFKDWADSMDLDNKEHPVTMVNLTFMPISVLAEWDSVPFRYLEEVCAEHIASLDAKYRNMVVQKPINEKTQKDIIQVNDWKIDWLIDEYNAADASYNSYWKVVTPARYRNAIDASREAQKILEEFNDLVKNPTQSGENVKEWAEDQLKNIKKKYPKSWGIFPKIGYDSTDHNRIWEDVYKHIRYDVLSNYRLCFRTTND